MGRTGGWSAGWGGQGVFHTPYPLVLARKTRENSFCQESLTPASAPQATLVLSNSKTANQAPGHV